MELETQNATRQWFVIHTYSGYEGKVKRNLEQRRESLRDRGGDKIFDIFVPEETEMELKHGQRQEVKKKVFPGYVLVQMEMTPDSWSVVRNTPGVTSFVGSGNSPIPLPDNEVKQILRQSEAEVPRVKPTFTRGQNVRITDGPFAEFIGVVDEVAMERNKVKVLVSFFGRETPVELDFLQVEKI